jgi:hypothetical protein
VAFVMLRHPTGYRTPGEIAHQSTWRGPEVPIRKRRTHWSWIVAFWARQWGTSFLISALETRPMQIDEASRALP